MANSWYDPTKLAAALAAQSPGSDGRNILTSSALMSILNPIDAPNYVPAGDNVTYSGGADASIAESTPYNAYYTSSTGQQMAPVNGADYGLDPNGQYFQDRYNNPTGGSADQANVVYQIKGGQAVPVVAYNQYDPGGWVGGGRTAAILAGSVLGAGALGAAAGAGGAAADSAAAGGAAGGTAGSAMDAAAIDGLGSGMSTATAGSAAGTAGATGGLLGGGSPSAVTTAETAGGAGAAAGSGGSAAGTTASTGGGLLGSSGQLISGISNGQLLQAGVGLAGAVAGAAGSKGGLNSATTTNQNTVDPRVAQYIYGANGNSGLLGNVNTLMNSQLATGGLNSTQQQGLNMQLQALQNPAYTSSLNQMRSVGSGLLGGSQAGNPFTSGQAATPYSQGSAQPSQQAMPPGFQPMATQLNPRPQMTGLLGNLRPMGQ